MTESELQNLIKGTVLKDGIEVLLPQNLSDEAFNLLHKEASDWHEGGEECSGLLFCVITILSFQRQSPNVEFAMSELNEYVNVYCMLLGMEYWQRVGRMTIRPQPSIENIFDLDSQFEVELIG